jgi:serine phosphatase RsbU (regulator of sigma subunit)
MADIQPTLSVFAERHIALLDAMAAIWAPVGTPVETHTGRFTWRDPQGHLLYTAGVEESSAIDAQLLYGSLRVEGADASRQPLLTAQAELLQAAIEHESEVDLLTEELMHTTDQLVALFEISAAVRAGRDVGHVMHTCVEQAKRLTGAACAMLVVREPGHGGAPRVFAYPDPNDDPNDSSNVSDNVEALIVALDRGCEAAIANSPDECAELCGESAGGLKRLAFAPIPIGGQPDACLGVLNKTSDFISGDLKLIVALADAAAANLERERNYQRELSQARVRRELEIASDIQSRLLPRDVPTVPGVQVAALSRAAGEVGGDFFDVQVLPGDVLAVALGDTAGKGVPAALFMAMARVLLRVGLQSTRLPGEALKMLNAGLAGDLSDADLFLTLFAATFDPVSGQLRAINCGQSPVLLYHGGEVSEWEADGPPIGVLPDLTSSERLRQLESGDVLVVLSDGFNEARDASGRRIGVGPLVEVVRRAAGGDAGTIASALWQCVDAFERGAALSDDQTLIVMKVE